MPVSKKPRKTGVKSGKTSKSMGPSDLRGMEGMLAALNEFRGEGRIEAAQEIMYEAWETPARSKRIALARKALKISPLCADAYVLLAEEDAKSVEEELDLLPERGRGGRTGAREGRVRGICRSLLGLSRNSSLHARAGRSCRRALAAWPSSGGDRPLSGDAQAQPQRQSGHPLRAGRASAGARRYQGPEEAHQAIRRRWRRSMALHAGPSRLSGKRSGCRPGKLAEEAWLATACRVLSGKQPLVASTDGYITMGGEDEAADYVEENGQPGSRRPAPSSGWWK